MSRPRRYALSSFPQHVVQRGNNRQTTFFVDQDYRCYLDCLHDACTRYDCQIHAYVLMPNHAHVLLTPARPDAITKVMQSVGRRYVRYANDRYRRSGTLWEGRYKACLIDPVQYLLACYRYIEFNPVRANLATHAGDYAWSSYAHHAGIRVDPLVSDHVQYLALGRTDMERQSAYRNLFRLHLPEMLLSAIRATTNQCLVLGNERFKDEVEQALSRRVRPGRAGRPKKDIAI
jgi:putative transposase